MTYTNTVSTVIFRNCFSVFSYWIYKIVVKFRGKSTFLYDVAVNSGYDEMCQNTPIVSEPRKKVTNQQMC